jgi:hypothetical protein
MTTRYNLDGTMEPRHSIAVKLSLLRNTNIAQVAIYKDKKIDGFRIMSMDSIETSYTGIVIYGNEYISHEDDSSDSPIVRVIMHQEWHLKPWGEQS